jgi:hypothetical protein
MTFADERNASSDRTLPSLPGDPNMPNHPTAPQPSRPAPRNPGRDRTHPSDRRERVIIGDYEIERTLGNGSFGKVKRAWTSFAGWLALF